ncbi:MAG TPA: hypothetical protein VMD91_08940 [Candidatus Sulfotelmatobacter sp.]|nr:hypothetical protein [Candidatus Sulfotelmatobacter sp.]
MQLFPERGKSARRLLLWAIVVSLLVHVLGGTVWTTFWSALKPRAERDVAAETQRITIEHLKPLPTPSPSPTPRPVVTPTPKPTPTPVKIPSKVALPSIAPHAVAQRLPSKGFAHHPVVKRPTGITKTRPVHAPKAPTVVANHVELSRPHGPPQHASSALDPQQIAALDAKFSQTIAQAQHDVAQGPPTATPGGTETMKQYNPILAGTPGEVSSDVAPCYDIIDYKRVNGIDYHWLHCTWHFSDGYVDTVDVPWPQRFPAGNDPLLTRRTVQFNLQEPPPGYVLPDPFPLSRVVCAFYRARCEAVLARERANGTIDEYGKPP